MDEQRGLLLAGCATGSTGVLLDVDNDGMCAATHSVEGEEALMAHAPGATSICGPILYPEIATLEATREGELKLSRMAVSPQAGHCLTPDDLGHYWTCDESGGRLLGYTDPGQPCCGMPSSVSSSFGGSARSPSFTLWKG